MLYLDISIHHLQPESLPSSQHALTPDSCAFNTVMLKANELHRLLIMLPLEQIAAFLLKYSHHNQFVATLTRVTYNRFKNFSSATGNHSRSPAWLCPLHASLWGGPDRGKLIHLKCQCHKLQADQSQGQLPQHIPAHSSSHREIRMNWSKFYCKCSLSAIHT